MLQHHLQRLGRSDGRARDDGSGVAMEPHGSASDTLRRTARRRSPSVTSPATSPSGRRRTRPPVPATSSWEMASAMESSGGATTASARPGARRPYQDRRLAATAADGSLRTRRLAAPVAESSFTTVRAPSSRERMNPRRCSQRSTWSSNEVRGQLAADGIAELVGADPGSRTLRIQVRLGQDVTGRSAARVTTAAPELAALDDLGLGQHPARAARAPRGWRARPPRWTASPRDRTRWRDPSPPSPCRA